MYGVHTSALNKMPPSADGHLLRCAQGGMHTPEIGKLGLCQDPPQGGKLAPGLLEMDRERILQFFTLQMWPLQCRKWSPANAFRRGLGSLAVGVLHLALVP